MDSRQLRFVFLKLSLINEHQTNYGDNCLLTIVRKADIRSSIQTNKTERQTLVRIFEETDRSFVTQILRHTVNTERHTGMKLQHKSSALCHTFQLTREDFHFLLFLR